MRLLPNESIATPDDDDASSASVRARRKKDMLDAVSKSPADPLGTPARRTATRRSVRAASVASSRASSVAHNEAALPSMLQPELEPLAEVATPSTVVRTKETKERSVSVSAPERRASVAPQAPATPTPVEQALSSPLTKAQVYVPPNVWSSLSLIAIILTLLFLLSGAGLTLNAMWDRQGNATTVVYEFSGYESRLGHVEKQFEKLRNEYLPESIASVEKVIDGVKKAIPDAISGLESRFQALVSGSDRLEKRVQDLEAKKPELTKEEIVELIESALHPVAKQVVTLSNIPSNVQPWESLPNFALRSAGAKLFRGKPFTSTLASSKVTLSVLMTGSVAKHGSDGEVTGSDASADESGSLSDSLVDLVSGWYRGSPEAERMASLCPNAEPSECKCLVGASGNISIQTGGPLVISGITIDRFPDHLLYSPQAKLASPKDFEIYALFGENGAAKTFGEPIFRGTFAADGTGVQHFAIENVSGAFSVFQLRILRNQGHQDATCIHRFRIHGRMA